MTTKEFVGHGLLGFPLTATEVQNAQQAGYYSQSVVHLLNGQYNQQLIKKIKFPSGAGVREILEGDVYPDDELDRLRITVARWLRTIEE